MTLVEISEREVIAKAKAWVKTINTRESDDDPGEPEVGATAALYEAILLLHEREIVAGNLDRADVEKSSNCRICDKPIGVDLDAGECLGWHPDVKCVCGFEMMGSDARQYKFCPHCATPLGPNPRPGAAPIVRPAKKLSRREQMIEERRRSDRTGQHRDDIDYSSDELPNAR